LPLVISLVYHT